MSVALVLLAAGAGTRMGPGTNKLLLEVRGVPLVCHLAQVAQASRCDAVFAVVGSRAAEVRRALAARNPAGSDLRIVENAAWRSGIASSIRAAVTAVA